MKNSLLEYLVCPICKSELQADLKELTADGEYMSGTLSCHHCSVAYPILNGVPQLIATRQEVDGPSKTFGYEWRQHGNRKLEGNTVWGRTQEQDVSHFLEATGLKAEQLKEAIVMDVGCGSGQLTEGLGKYLPVKTVIGVDVHSAMEYPFRRCRHLPNIHIVNADLTALPFRKENADLIWCNGVIHHLSDPSHAFSCLTQFVKKGGRLYVWVYERRWSPFRLVKNVWNKMGLQKMPLEMVYWFCKIIAFPSFVLHSVYRGIRFIPFMTTSSSEGYIQTRYRSLKEIELTWFDAISPKYVYCYEEDEIKQWFLNHGFGSLFCYKQNKIGICGIKQ